MRPPPRAPHLLSDYLREAPFYTAQYRRPHHISGGLQEVINLRSNETNTARGVHALNNDIPDVFVSERSSVYNKPGSNIGKLDYILVGIILQD